MAFASGPRAKLVRVPPQTVESASPGSTRTKDLLTAAALYSSKRTIRQANRCITSAINARPELARLTTPVEKQHGLLLTVGPSRVYISVVTQILKRFSMQQVYQALADPNRRAILRALRSGELPAGVLAESVGLSPSALAHHLTVLKLADLVRVERRGQYRVYSLNTTVFQDVVSEILGWLTESTHEQDVRVPEGGES